MVRTNRSANNARNISEKLPAPSSTEVLNNLTAPIEKSAPVGLAIVQPHNTMRHKTTTKINMSGRCKEPEMLSLRYKTIKEFRKTLKNAQSAKRVHMVRQGCHSSCESGLFGMLDDDILLCIVDALMAMPDFIGGLAYIAHAKRTTVDTINMFVTCKRLYALLDTSGLHQKAELLARSSTVIVPKCLSLPTPFTEQMLSELSSCDQLVMLRSAYKSLACHCARQCCARYQKCFNKEVQRGEVLAFPTSTSKSPFDNFKLVPVFSTCNLLAPSHDGKATFAYIRELTKRHPTPANENRASRRCDKIVLAKKVEGKPEFCLHKEVEMDFSAMSPPLTMRSSQDGSAALFIS